MNNSPLNRNLNLTLNPFGGTGEIKIKIMSMIKIKTNGTKTTHEL